jgi:phosphoribosyl-ATP pyrophosphohydrolase
VPTAKRSTSRPLDKLERTIAARAESPKEKSYTTQLLSGGVEKIGAKILEEAGETVEAAGEVASAAGREHFIREVADLLYHLLVLMRHSQCTLADVESELGRRFGVSGIEEKASREKKKASTKKAILTKAPLTIRHSEQGPAGRSGG